MLETLAILLIALWRPKWEGMRKIRDLFEKIKDTRGIFHAKMGTIKDRNGMGLTEAEDLNKRWQNYVEDRHKIS